MSNTPQDKLLGKPWTTHSSHLSYEKAATIAKELIRTTLSVKIRRYSDDTFKVKTRTTIIAKASSKKKKNVDAVSEEKTQAKTQAKTKTKPKDERAKTRAQRRSEKTRRKEQQK